MSPFVCSFEFRRRKCVVTRQKQRPVNGIFNWRFFASRVLWIANRSDWQCFHQSLIQVWHFKASTRSLLSCSVFCGSVTGPFFLKNFSRQKCWCNDSRKPHIFDCRFCPICDWITEHIWASFDSTKVRSSLFFRNESESLFFLQSNCFSNFEIIFR